PPVGCGFYARIGSVSEMLREPCKWVSFTEALLGRLSCAARKARLPSGAPKPTSGSRMGPGFAAPRGERCAADTKVSLAATSAGFRLTCQTALSPRHCEGHRPEA